MSVPTTFSRLQFLGNGSGVSFAFPALVYYASEITVITTDPATNIDTINVLNTDYTIDPTQLGQPTGVNVVFTTAPASGIRITIARVVPNVQPVQLVEGAALPSIVMERQLDETIFQIQQIQDQLSRVGTQPLSSVIGTVINPLPSDYLPYDVSNGVTPRLSFTPGNTRDSSAGVDWIPSIAGVLLTHLPPPILVVGSTDTQVWLDYTIDPTTGFITAVTIASGVAMPSDTTTHAYQLLMNIVVTVSTAASIQMLGGGLRGSQNYFYCGLLPATTGAGHLFNS